MSFFTGLVFSGLSGTEEVPTDSLGSDNWLEVETALQHKRDGWVDAPETGEQGVGEPEEGGSSGENGPGENGPGEHGSSV